MEVGTVWTMANPKYKPGEPMLSDKALKFAGPSCQEFACLHHETKCEWRY